MGRAPKYQQITEWIQNQIASGELSGGDRLESEYELSARFRLSRQTVRHALSELEEAGIVSRVKGSGTYIQYGTGSTEHAFSDCDDHQHLCGQLYFSETAASDGAQAFQGGLQHEDHVHE